MNNYSKQACFSLIFVTLPFELQNVLENLENDYEADKRRLMALINSQKDEASAERLKQLEMARLRRQKKLLQQQGQLDEASALISMAMKNEENRMAG